MTDFTISSSSTEAKGVIIVSGLGSSGMGSILAGGGQVTRR